MTLEIEIGDGLLTFMLMLKSLGVGGGGWVGVPKIIVSVPFFSFEIQIRDGPGHELDNF